MWLAHDQLIAAQVVYFFTTSKPILSDPIRSEKWGTDCGFVYKCMTCAKLNYIENFAGQLKIVANDPNFFYILVR